MENLTKELGESVIVINKSIRRIERLESELEIAKVLIYRLLSNDMKSIDKDKYNEIINSELYWSVKDNEVSKIKLIKR